jgi:D-serine dehydratase
MRPNHLGALPDGIPMGATHLIWATGGGMVPEAQMAAYLDKH